ncbi:glycosyltransferase family 4 protein [Oryzomonas sagensis]|uniref:glycosyltransferase family 4 protein n=1 Tax=Oryzomonas sagensis TaxID=2603857 RepID=UPI001FEA7A65|nr:glycosyltransferase family 4 protein [Oryzomonas sagensis]
MLERRLRIMLLVPTPYFSDRGCDVRAYEEAKALIRCGHNVRIFTCHLGREMPGVATIRMPRVPWLKQLSVHPSWHKPYFDILMSYQALKFARAFRPHLIHAYGHEGAWIGGRLKKRLGIPLVFEYQGSLTGEMIEQGFIKEGSLLHRFNSWLERRINMRSADLIVTSSVSAARDLVGPWGADQKMVASLVDGVDTALFRPYGREEVRNKLRLPPGVPLVVYLGTLDRNQGIDALLSSIVLLRSKGSPIRFLIMGAPEEEYRAKAVELGIERMIIFTGRIDYEKAPFYLSAGDIAVSPKISLLGSNGKLLDYMACGLPIVAFDMPVNRELLGDAGVYAIYGDSSDLAVKMNWLLRNRDERARLGRLGREMAEQLHGLDCHGKALSEIYRTRLKM